MSALPCRHETDLNAKRLRCIKAKSLSGVILSSSILAVCIAVVMVGWAYLPNSETKNISIIEVMQGFSPLGRADCSPRAEEAYGEQSVAPLIANKQAELEKGVEQCFDNNGSTPLLPHF